MALNSRHEHKNDGLDINLDNRMQVAKEDDQHLHRANQKNQTN